MGTAGHQSKRNGVGGEVDNTFHTFFIPVAVRAIKAPPMPEV